MKKKKWVSKKFKNNSRGAKAEKYIANIHHLTRIITFLSEVDCAYKKQIYEGTGMHGSIIKSALTFLLNNKILFVLKIVRVGKFPNIKYYALNPLFK